MNSNRMSWQQQAVDAVDHHEIESEDGESMELLTDGLVTDEIVKLTAIATAHNLTFLVTGHDDGDVRISLKKRAGE